MAFDGSGSGRSRTRHQIGQRASGQHASDRAVQLHHCQVVGADSALVGNLFTVVRQNLPLAGLDDFQQCQVLGLAAQRYAAERAALGADQIHLGQLSADLGRVSRRGANSCRDLLGPDGPLIPAAQSQEQQDVHGQFGCLGQHMSRIPERPRESSIWKLEAGSGPCGNQGSGVARNSMVE